MTIKVDLTHQTFGKLFVIGKTDLKKGHQNLWACHCDCKNFRLFTTNFLTKRGAVDCGCEHISNVSKARTQHGYKGTRLYVVVDAVIRRCHDIKKDNYSSYGAKGITVCEQWRNDRGLFCKWLEDQGYREGLQVDRIDNNKGYSPDNCRLIPNSFNNINKSGANSTGVCGVYFRKGCNLNPFQSSLRLYNKEYVIGRYSDFNDAKRVREYVASNLCDKVAHICRSNKEIPVEDLKPQFLSALDELLKSVKA